MQTKYDSSLPRSFVISSKEWNEEKIESEEEEEEEEDEVDLGSVSGMYNDALLL